MDKQVFSADNVTKILNLSATSEMARAFESAITQGIMTSDANPATAVSWWRSVDGFLFATRPTKNILGCRHVELQLNWDGYYPTA